MSRQITTYTPPQTSLSTQAEPFDGAGAPPPKLFSVLRRRWRMVATIWGLMGGVALPYVWLQVKPTWTATAQVQVAPILPAILYNDADSRAMPFFREFLSTQSQLIVSRRVLQEAVKSAAVQEVPLARVPNAVSVLRESLDVAPLPDTHLLAIEVTQLNEPWAIALCQAVVEAYMDNAVTREDSKKQFQLEVLAKELEQLRIDLHQQQARIGELSADYQTATGSMLNAIREALMESTAETRRALERVELEIIDLELKLEQLEAGHLAVLPSEESEAGNREEAIEADPTVRALRDELATVAARLLQLRSVLTDAHREVIAVSERKAQLEADLEAQRQAVTDRLTEGGAGQANEVLEESKARVQIQLETARHRREMLARRVETRDAEGMAIGRRERQIDALLEQKKITQEEYDRVSERIKQMAIEAQRPARVSIVSEAEILPQGWRDDRPKYSVLAVLGGFFLGLLAALLRDRLDPQLHGPEQVEAGMGLRLLGAVPCVSELKAGRVTQDDFLESYRVVRATLSSLGPNGLPPQCVLITSAQAGEGKTSLSVGLSASLAETGARILLVDADTQAPSIHRFFNMKPAAGLESVLSGTVPLAEAVLSSQILNVDVLAAGVDGVPHRGTLDWRSVQRVIEVAERAYDYVVIDTPPALGAADALVWSRVVDGIVLSSLAARSDTTAMRLACQRLRSVGANLFGAVVGNVSINESYYSHSMNTSQTVHDQQADDLHRRLLIDHDPQASRPQDPDPPAL